MNIVYRKDEREREREGNVLVSVGLKLFLMSLPAAVCGAAFARVSLLRASHASECTSLTLSISIPHTHAHAVTRSPSEPHSWRAVASSVRLNHPLLPHFHPHFSLRPLLLPHSSSLSCFVLISLSLCENFMIQLMADEFPLIASSFLSKTATSYPETAACKYSVCVCDIYQSHTTLATCSPAVFFVSTCNIFIEFLTLWILLFRKYMHLNIFFIKKYFYIKNTFYYQNSFFFLVLSIIYCLFFK